MIKKSASYKYSQFSIKFQQYFDSIIVKLIEFKYFSRQYLSKILKTNLLLKITMVYQIYKNLKQ